ncbi:hypothetical protein KCP73_01850 [Salmonella enterica subsp. enterica]|nr:hypothetical protein KCP73_01850 [Salmonella enterica subsp. enterica]
MPEPVEEEAYRKLRPIHSKNTAIDAAAGRSYCPGDASILIAKRKHSIFLPSHAADAGILPLTTLTHA